MRPRLATIELDWLEGEIDNLNVTIQELIKKKIENHRESKFREIENRLDLLAHELLVLHNLRKKCIPINELKEPELPSYCVVKNKEYCFLSGKCKECSAEEPQLGTIKENAYNTGFVGITIRDPEQTLFLSKTCINNWENNKFCENENKCELCKIKIPPPTETDPR